MKTILNKDLLKNLNSKNYQVAQIALKKILKSKTINNEGLKQILTLSNKIIVSEFFFKFSHFSQKNFEEMESFINNNLKHRNKLFVSDLIEIAIDFNLDIDYKKCVSLLNKEEKDNHYVLIAAAEYLFSNLKTSYFTEIVKILDKILSKKSSDPIIKIITSFYLYRITHQELYFNQLKKNLTLDKESKELVRNLLNKEFNKKEYFFGYTAVVKLVK